MSPAYCFSNQDIKGLGNPFKRPFFNQQIQIYPLQRWQSGYCAGLENQFPQGIRSSKCLAFLSEKIVMIFLAQQNNSAGCKRKAVAPLKKTYLWLRQY